MSPETTLTSNLPSASETKYSGVFTRRDFAKAIALGLLLPNNLLSTVANAADAPRLTLDFGGPASGLNEIVLFPFDDHTIPYRYQIQLGMVSATNPNNPHHRVLEKGGRGSADAENIHFYGTVRRVGDELRMWYIGCPALGVARVCYAVSQDGLKWEKPALGLVEFGGDKNNNFVDLPRTDIAALLVLHEPDDPTPERRFKMTYEISPSYIGAAFSADGLRWKESPRNPIIKHNNIEPGGLTKFNGCYYMTGQGGSLGTKRALVTYQSYDFDNWTDAVALGLRRDLPPYREAPGMHAGEQVHLGAALWNRGNVLLGVYGQWHGESNDRRFLTLDLGFVVSNDALHYREPAPNFQIVSAYEVNMSSKANATVPAPALEQGQAFENFGDRTFFYYSPWYGGAVCLASWARDRLGYFETVKGNRAAHYALDEIKPPAKPETKSDSKPKSKSEPPAPGPHFISCPIQVQGSNARMFLNAAGLSEQTQIVVELLDKQFRPLPGYSGDDCIPVATSGLREPVSWKNKKSLDPSLSPVRLRVSWKGSRTGDGYVFAIYLSEK